MRRNLMSRIEKMANLETGRELYAVIVGNLPFRKKVVKRFANFIKRLDGAVAVTPCYPNGTIVYFDTLNDAKRGKTNSNVCFTPWAMQLSNSLSLKMACLKRMQSGDVNLTELTNGTLGTSIPRLKKWYC